MKLAATACVALVLAIAGCGSAGGQASTSKAQPHQANAGQGVAQLGSRVSTRATRYGRILTDGRGYALYVFTRESDSRSQCYGACAKAWPPLLSRARPSAGEGARARSLGTTQRRDGSTQVTYRGRPLYYYIGDRKPGQVLCQNVVEYGGRWLVADRTGRPIR